MIKKVFVLDFANTYEDIQKAFAPYYTTTLLSNSVTPSAIYDLEVEIDGYLILNDLEIESFNEILYSGKEIKAKERKMIRFLIWNKAKKRSPKNIHIRNSKSTLFKNYVVCLDFMNFFYKSHHLKS